MDYLAEEYKDCGKGCNSGSGSGEKIGRQVLIDINQQIVDIFTPSLFPDAFQFSRRSRHEPSDDALESVDRAGEAKVDAVLAGIGKGRSGGV
jgi:hypothetical protein